MSILAEQLLSQNGARFRQPRRAWFCGFVLRVLVVLTPGHADTLPAGTAGPAVRVADFVAAEGVDTHINYTDGRYARRDVVLRELRFLGITRVRDAMAAPGAFGSAPLGAYLALAQAGVRFTFYLGGIDPGRPAGTPENPTLAQRVANVAGLMAAVPGCITGVEGVNEINNEPIEHAGHGHSRRGQDELDAALAYQAALYRLVRATPVLAGVPVLFFTGYGAGSIPAGPDPAATPGLADADNQHPYPNGGGPPAAWVARHALSNETPADAARRAPAIYTETGYAGMASTTGGVPPEVQARYTLDLLLDTAAAGIGATYLYELMDAYPVGSRQGNHGFGLFDVDGAPKPVAVALRAQNAILADPAADAHRFAPHPLAATVQGAGATVFHLTMARSDGATVLALWDEQPIWDGRAQVVAQPHPVRVSFPRQVSGGVFDPLRGTGQVARVERVVSVTLTDHPVFLIVRPD